MPRIVQLPPTVINQIAAGEVIERPASVVKELLENSIDAGSNRIDIELEQGGTERIAIFDDGCGIAAEELPLALSSHATSKLRNADDLFAIRSMGFRGEALASIGSVARVTLQSRTHDSETGAELQCNGGDFSEIRSWNGSPGTRIEVKHLFYATPVRKKFLKQNATELGHITESFTKIALANTDVHLTLKHNNRMIYEVPAGASLLDRIRIFFGDEIAKHLFPVHREQGPVSLTGFIADPACDRGNSKLQYFFLNQRWFRDRSLGHALQEGYRGLLMTNRYCIGFLFLQMPPEMFDINVHPTKAEVRFIDSQALYHVVRGAIRQTLADKNLIPHLQLPEGIPNPVPVRDQGLFSTPRKELSNATPAPWESKSFEPIPRYVPPPPNFDLPKPRAEETPATSFLDPIDSPPAAVASESPKPVPSARPVILSKKAIQIHDSYLVLETTEGMLLIDQHALHERILYEQFRKRIGSGNLEVQRLLIPEPIDLPPDQVAIVLEAKQELKELGWEVGEFGTGTILLSSYPALLKRGTPGEWFQGVIDTLLTKEKLPSREALFNNILATMACKAAVKAGDPLSPEEISYLMELRDMAEDSHHCPHGRPTSLLFSHKDLEKQFKRI
ncbi:DNA mismatch repair endonuclease MutL [Telmatocola sphagniphila]|uniref:DNA mismatch repair protein MutL n=1 Tax=Telmatocola sphagniphila TaxID=1123043 RepID=A0A8E6F0D0_9BACT|nr:DNA mismatch repair endonuclease MutL [Telmatocola sphagniphila]QVL34673.1 DNA mismatch repair endonuclease MutL [Telmatocola sphagniphila]